MVPWSFLFPSTPLSLWSHPYRIFFLNHLIRYLKMGITSVVPSREQDQPCGLLWIWSPSTFEGHHLGFSGFQAEISHTSWNGEELPAWRTQVLHPVSTEHKEEFPLITHTSHFRHSWAQITLWWWVTSSGSRWWKSAPWAFLKLWAQAAVKLPCQRHLPLIYRGMNNLGCGGLLHSAAGYCWTEYGKELGLQANPAVPTPKWK